jgi:hypothetical protein
MLNLYECYRVGGDITLLLQFSLPHEGFACLESTTMPGSMVSLLLQRVLSINTDAIVLRSL